MFLIFILFNFLCCMIVLIQIESFLGLEASVRLPVWVMLGFAIYNPR